jgi:hypothetical protein
MIAATNVLAADEPGDEMRDEYDFSPGELREDVRGKYTAGFPEGVNLVPIDPDLGDVFPDAESVNQALRAMASVIRARLATREAAGEQVEVTARAEPSGEEQSATQGDALAVLEKLVGTVEATTDWAAEHDHYLYDTPKRSDPP